MKFLPGDILEKLEFDKIKELLSSYCKGDEARTQLLHLVPKADLKDISAELDNVVQFKKSLENGENIPINQYESIDEEIDLLKTKGYVLEIDSILKLQRSIVAAYEIKSYFTIKRIDDYMKIGSIANKLHDHKLLYQAIEKIFDLDGSIKTNASPELQRIFKNIQSKLKSLDSVFRDIANSYKSKDWLTDNIETLRNGRRVLSVNAEHKRKIRGIIHDESATGKTAYVEPERVIEINNDIFDLENEKKKEVYKLIKVLCDKLRPERSAISENHRLLIQFDNISARAKFAIDLKAKKPQLSEGVHFGFKEAYHPLLKWMNDKVKKNTVPFDLELHGQNRIVIISGPNAGGKSVTMKAVGLLQIMLQSGLLIPVDENSKLGIFSSLYCDIGDQQSLEDDLSTYSSRLTNMKNFINVCDDKSLLLIDEFGSGTDPKIGGALAEAMLREFNFKKVMGVITTHYSNIKFYAFKTKGIVNASMLFNKSKLTPTYQLKVGKPGSSFAFEIANKIGLDKKLMDYAKHKTGKNEKAIDDLLINLQNDKQNLEKKVSELISKEQSLQKLIDNYENMYGQLEFNRKKLKLEQKSQNLRNADEENIALKALLKELRAKEDIQKVEALVKKKKKEEKQLKEEITELKEVVYYKEVYDISEFKIGSFAKLREGGSTGKIIDIKGDNIELALGLMQMVLNVKELIPSNEPITINSQRSIKTDIEFKHGFESKLDIRGYLISDAMEFVQEFMDTALIQNVSQLTIVHGIGTGKLRQAVHNKLKEYKQIEKIWHPEEEFGGTGITYINL